MAFEHDYDIRLVEPNTKWKFNANELAKRNKHNVPLAKIKMLINDYEHNIDLQKILNQFKSETEKFEKMRSNMLKPSGLLLENNSNLKALINGTTYEWSTLSDSILCENRNQLKIDSLQVSTSQTADKQMQTSSEAFSFFDTKLSTKARSINAGEDQTKEKLTRLNAASKSCDTSDLATHAGSENFIFTFKNC
jgi:hypothetical protein